EPSSRGSKRKTQEEPVRISIEIPKKGEDVAAEGDEDTTLVPLVRKKRATRGGAGRSLLQ
ncbi:hypothetical protein A2U01_0099497, partial [Trifolium medium]|nr:hypothetical protein [Trifolium medium]